MVEFRDKYADSGRYSQNGEEGIINECLRRIKPENKVSVEFGCPNPFYCSNTNHLDGWIKYFYGLNNAVGVIQLMITEANVNSLPHCSLLSIDIDGNDYNVWNAYSGTPDIVVIEINSSVDPMGFSPVSHHKHGTAYRPMVELGISKGYFLLCHTGNLVFVRNDHRHLFPEIKGDGISNYSEYFDRQWLSC